MVFQGGGRCGGETTVRAESKVGVVGRQEGCERGGEGKEW